MVKVFQTFAKYQQALLAGEVTAFTVSPGWVAARFGVNRQYLDYYMKKGVIDAVKIKTAGERQTMILLDPKQIEKFLRPAGKVA